MQYIRISGSDVMQASGFSGKDRRDMYTDHVMIMSTACIRLVSEACWQGKSRAKSKKAIGPYHNDEMCSN
jgi:hypothetical protein